MPVRKTRTAGKTLRPSGETGERICGFCETDDHHHCPVAIKNAVRGKTWVCPCALKTPGRHIRYEKVLEQENHARP